MPGMVTCFNSSTKEPEKGTSLNYSAYYRLQSQRDIYSRTKKEERKEERKE